MAAASAGSAVDRGEVLVAGPAVVDREEVLVAAQVDSSVVSLEVDREAAVDAVAEDVAETNGR